MASALYNVRLRGISFVLMGGECEGIESYKQNVIPVKFPAAIESLQ